MTPRRPTARERIADWTLAYHVMLEEMNPNDGWEVLAEGVTGRNSTNAAASSRTAALAAAILVANAGVERSVSVAVAEEDPYGNGGYGPEERP